MKNEHTDLIFVQEKALEENTNYVLNKLLDYIQRRSIEPVRIKKDKGRYTVDSSMFKSAFSITKEKGGLTLEIPLLQESTFKEHISTHNTKTAIETINQILKKELKS